MVKICLYFYPCHLRKHTITRPYTLALSALSTTKFPTAFARDRHPRIVHLAQTPKTCSSRSLSALRLRSCALHGIAIKLTSGVPNLAPTVDIIRIGIEFKAAAAQHAQA